ncbi:hypothetical protein BJF78_12220 [Pseudonocardia sp. CNS-139]|nr:hypothetical protein BJF78_12220 [Pseudonocardia sp. CNS-139]
MGLSGAEVDRVVALLERESQTKVAQVLRTAAALLDWLADVVDMASALWGRLRQFAADIWRDLRGIFL